MTPREKTAKSLADGYGGDIYRRRFVGDVAQCGCRWQRFAAFGDVLILCPMHAEHSDAAARRSGLVREIKP